MELDLAHGWRILSDDPVALQTLGGSPARVQGCRRISVPCFSQVVGRVRGGLPLGGGAPLLHGG